MGRQSKYQVIISEQAKRMLVSQAAFLAQASLAAAGLCMAAPLGRKSFLGLF